MYTGTDIYMIASREFMCTICGIWWKHTWL